MKKILLILFVLLQASVFSQDAYTTIGKLKLRYDADSNRIRIGYVGTLTGISNLRIAKELDGQLFNFNTSQFTWSTSTGLNLNTGVFSQDSLYSKIVSSYKDTSWIVLGETVTKHTFLSLKKTFFSGSVNNSFDWKWFYRSFDENGVLLAIDSPLVINNILEIDQDENISLNYDGTYSKIDSLRLDAGTYNITFSFMFERYNPANVAAVGIIDTVEIALKEENSAPNVYIKRFIRNIHMYPATNSMNGGVLTWTASFVKFTNKSHVYLYGRYLATALSNALLSGVTAHISRGSIVATLVK